MPENLADNAWNYLPVITADNAWNYSWTWLTMPEIILFQKSRTAFMVQVFKKKSHNILDEYYIAFFLSGE